MAPNSSLLFLALFVPLIFSNFSTSATADTASDVAECGTALVGMQTCLSYVQSTAKAPTPDCCAGLKDVLARSPKCLCVLVKDHDDPQLPIKINVSRALALPAACTAAAANISACPKLLHLPPNSEEAEIFKQTPSTSTTQGAKGKSSASTEFTGSSKTTASSGSSIHRGWKYKTSLKRQLMVAACLLLLLLLSDLLPQLSSS